MRTSVPDLRDTIRGGFHLHGLAESDGFDEATFGQCHPVCPDAEPATRDADPPCQQLN